LNRKQPYIKGEAKILDEEGNVIGYETVAYWNPDYRPYTIADVKKDEAGK